MDGVIALVTLGLLAWCIILQTQVSDLKSTLGRLMDRRSQFPQIAPRSAPAAERAPDPAPVADIPQAAPFPAPVEAALVAIPAAAFVEAPAPEAADRPPPLIPTFDLSQRSVADWLSENGLAWIGGGALALGGLLLVAYAAQRGLFTPGLRIVAASVVGVLSLGVGEVLRRGLKGRIEPNLLVAGLTTAAGAAILYAAIWAAYRLYGFIPGEAAAVLLAAVSVGLLALALMHGEPLGVLAIAGAFAVPVVTGGDWAGWPLDLYVALILATGMAAAGLRRWTLAGAIALAGAGLWALGREIASDVGGACLLTAAAPALTFAADLWSSPRAPPDRRPFAHLILAAALGSSLLIPLLWLTQGGGLGPYAAIATAALLAALALAIRRLGTSPRILIVPAAATALGVLIVDLFGPHDLHALWLAPAIAALAATGFDAARASQRPREAALIGAGGAALCLTLAAPALAAAAPDWDWAIDTAFALLLASGAWLLVRRAAETTDDLIPAAWIAAAAEAFGLALRAGLDERVTPTAYGLLGLALAGLALRVRWRGFAETAAVACLAAFAVLLTRPIAGAAVNGEMSWWMMGAIAAGAVAAQSATWGVLRRRGDVAASRETVSTLAVITALLGAFLALQAFAAPKAGEVAGLDPFTLASLRTLLLLVTGLMLSLRGAATPLGRARGPVLLAVGAVHGLIWQVLAHHPWWGDGGPVIGPPLIDGLLLGLLAPALILGRAARRLTGRAGGLAVWTLAAALVFLGVWLISELRRLFQGSVLDGPGFGYAEIAAYGAAVLGVALMTEGLRRRFAGAGAHAETIALAANGVGGLAIALALWLLAYVDSPWWGPLDGDLQAPILLAAILAAACGLGAALALVARRTGRPILAHAALVATGIEVFVWLTLAVRFAFHGGAMRAPLREASLETWTFSAVWALFGLVVLGFGASRRDPPLRWLALAILLGTTLKVFLFDMARLEGVVRAASFLALGVVLLVGALAARRLGGAGRQSNSPSQQNET